MKNIYVKNILKELEKNGYEAYLVGGAVRDHLIGKKTNDYDIATNAIPSELLNIFGAPSKNVAYGCYNIKYKGLNIDITTYRIENSLEEQRHPKINYTNNLIEDAKRRDFTINAIYENKNGKKIDLYDGIKHIKERKIVCVGNPYEKLKSDPLRILRAIRFAVTLNFTLDEELKKSIIKNKKLILTLSKERILWELNAIFLANGFYLLEELGISDLLLLDCKNVVYVPDLAGLWAQVFTEVDYPLEKELKNSIKRVNKIIKCGTITMYDLYENGLYLCLVASDILHINRSKIEKMYAKMPIKSRHDLKIKGDTIRRITNCDLKEIKEYLSDLERNILDGNVKNRKKDIYRYLERRRSKNANA